MPCPGQAWECLPALAAVTHFEVGSAQLVVVSSDADGTPAFELRITTDAAIDLRGRGDLRTRWPPRLTGLMALGCQSSGHEKKSNEELLEAVQAVSPQAPGPIDALSRTLQRHAGTLTDELDYMKNDITARFIQRSAQAFTALLLLLLGAVLAMLMRNRLPLLIYGIAFLPAVADILLISGGEQMVKYGDVVPGAIVAWSGNGLLVFLILLFWWRLSRN